MINVKMKNYDYFTLGANDAYGQPQVPTEPTGQIKMAIHLVSKILSENSLYSGAQYIGLTIGNINDTDIIQYNNEKLKVLYVIPEGRYKQVFLSRM